MIAGLSVDHTRREAVISVVDNGPGIAPDFLPKIFDRFTRADKARSARMVRPVWGWLSCRLLCRRMVAQFRCRVSPDTPSLRCDCRWNPLNRRVRRGRDGKSRRTIAM